MLPKGRARSKEHQFWTLHQGVETNPPAVEGTAALDDDAPSKDDDR